jgi:cob(I)alamin adenosyltransferase
MTNAKSSIYTKGGDKGETSLVGGTRIPKSHLQIESYGNVDELNSLIGVLRSEITANHAQQELLFAIQNELFVLGSILATEVDKRELYKIPKLKQELLTQIESAIDMMDAKMPKLKNFILPGGHKSSAHAHVVRTVCRRAERSMVDLVIVYADEALVPNSAIMFINRLSDYFFVLARYLNFEVKVPDVIWES